MKKILFYLLVISVVGPVVQAQNTVTGEIKSTKKSQSSLYNEFYAGYGALSIYYFTGRMSHSNEFPTETNYYDGIYYSSNPVYTEPVSPGTFYLGFARSLNKVVSVGFMFGYQDLKYSKTFTDTATHTINADDQLFTGIARVTFCYLNKPFIRMYSGIGIGITVDFGKASGDIKTATERKLWPGGQLTLMGLRFGRAFGGFLEFGLGSYGILNAGISYKFSD
jgi:opacity protein-like surface antigen